MAMETELYLIYCENMFEEIGVSPCVVTSHEEFIQKGIEDNALQEVATKAGQVMRVMRVTEAESMYKITPETDPDDEIDEEWREQKFALPFFDQQGTSGTPDGGPAF